MTDPFMAGFVDELEKTAVVGRLIKGVAKRPLTSLFAGLTVAGALGTGMSAYKRGKGLGQGPKYLQGGYSEDGVPGVSGREAHTNYNSILKRTPSKRALKAIHGKYDESKFKK